MNKKTWIIILAVAIGAYLIGFYQNSTSNQIGLNKQCSDSARDYFVKMKPPTQDSNDVNNPYTLQQSLFNFSLNTCILEVTYGSSTLDYPVQGSTASSANDIIYDVYKNKQLGTNEIDIYTDGTFTKKEKITSFCKTWVGNGPWINDTCKNANQKFDEYKKSLGL